MIRLIKMFSIMVMILVLSSVVYGQKFVMDKETLKGLKGVQVLVEELDSDIVKDGLSKSSIQTDVELKLRMAGIKVLTEEKEWLKEPGNPYLYVKVSSLKKETMGLHAINIVVELRQVVYLMRDPKFFCTATTWRSKESIGTVSVSIVNKLREPIKDQVDVFINDYLEMNPKE